MAVMVRNYERKNKSQPPDFYSQMEGGRYRKVTASPRTDKITEQKTPSYPSALKVSSPVKCTSWAGVFPKWKQVSEPWFWMPFQWSHAWMLFWTSASLSTPQLNTWQLLELTALGILMEQILRNAFENKNISKPVPAGVGFTCPCQNIAFSFQICCPLS